MISLVNPSILAPKGAAAKGRCRLAKSLLHTGQTETKTSMRSDCALHKRFNEQPFLHRLFRLKGHNQSSISFVLLCYKLRLTALFAFFNPPEVLAAMGTWALWGPFR